MGDGVIYRYDDALYRFIAVERPFPPLPQQPQMQTTVYETGLYSPAAFNESMAKRTRRPTRSESFMDRAHVGVAIVQDGHVVVDGYNGAPAGEAHCDDVGHDMEDGHCVRSAHAEANAIAFAAKHGIRLGGGMAYVTHYPCWPCMRLLRGAGVIAVYYDERYRPDARVEGLCLRQQITLAHYSQGPG